MPRFVLAIIALILVVPSALAAPLATVGVAPGGEVVRDDTKPYYLLATASEPEGPRRAQHEDDCAYDANAPSDNGSAADDAALELVGAIAGWNALHDPRLSTWYPTCISAGFAASNAPAATNSGIDGYAAYDVTTGRYYLDSDNSASVPLPAAPTVRVLVLMTGTIGVGSQADCEGCPPPTV